MGSLGHVESYLIHLEQIVNQNQVEEIYQILINEKNTFAGNYVSDKISRRLPEEYHNKILALSLTRQLPKHSINYLGKFK